MYAALGAVAGVAFAIGLEGKAQAAKGFLAGVMGAILGSIIFSVIHTILYPLEWDFSPMPGKTTSRLFAHLCTSLLVAICVVVALTGQRPQTGSNGRGPEHKNV
jgi:hypothetical protein